MTMTPELAIALATILAKYGPDAAIAIANWFKKGTTIDEAIAACENIKTAEQYLEEAKKAAAAAVVAATTVTTTTVPAVAAMTDIPIVAGLPTPV